MILCLVGLFARALDGVNVKELISNISSGVGAAPAAGGGGGGGAAPVAEEKKGKYSVLFNWVVNISIIQGFH